MHKQYFSTRVLHNIKNWKLHGATPFITITSLLLILLMMTISSTFSHANQPTDADKEMVSALIMGSAEHPDPVLQKVLKLEKDGIIQHVIVMETFPVQINLIGPRNVIKQLESMPRKISPSFQ